MTTQFATSQPSIERVQIKRLTSIVFGMTSLSAIPGFVAGWYPMLLLLERLTELFTSQNPSSNMDWTSLLVVSTAIILGWWLYLTYWLELSDNNRFGKLSWLLSTLLNSFGTAYLFVGLSNHAFIFSSDLLLTLFCFLWLLTMTMLSARVWMLRLKERV